MHQNATDSPERMPPSDRGPAASRQTASRQLVATATDQIVRQLLDRRNGSGWWTGQLSSSALSTATATMALHLAIQALEKLTRDRIADGQRDLESISEQLARYRLLVRKGLLWLAEQQNADGGWGDTNRSLSNISTTFLSYAVFAAVSRDRAPDSDFEIAWEVVTERARVCLDTAGGVDAVLKRYGRDRTFSVPILTQCALAGVVDWNRVVPLPLELSCLPAKFYSLVRLPVVSYALPALIAIGQVIFRHRGHWNPLVRWIRGRAIAPSLRVLESIQPPHGGFLEATPLTSFVGMSLIGCDLFDHPVTQRCLQFIANSVRDDGSWPIDTNLATWVTTLSVNALAGARHSITDLSSTERETIREWILGQQYRTIHPYTNAEPGGWSWTDLPGGVPDADDTPGAMLALMNLREVGESFGAEELTALRNATVWLLDLQNRDGGWPTFCRGWGALPFDRSSNDLTAHAIRAVRLWMARGLCSDMRIERRARSAIDRAFRFLKKTQRPDGAWLPLWFGHQLNEGDENPLYGTAKVLMSFHGLDAEQSATEMAYRAVDWIVRNQNDDGSWSARRGLPGSVEETGLAVEALASKNLLGLPGASHAAERGASWLAMRVNEGTAEEASPIGFYFAKLWYFESLYPTIFAASGLKRWQQMISSQ